MIELSAQIILAKNLAEEAMRLAYAPYSKFYVGACLISASQRYHAAGNVENLSYGLTICAERAALCRAIAEGEQKFLCLAIVSDSSKPIVPCGACRQVLAEFGPDLPVYSFTSGGKSQSWVLHDLLPFHDQGILR